VTWLETPADAVRSALTIATPSLVAPRRDRTPRRDRRRASSALEAEMRVWPLRAVALLVSAGLLSACGAAQAHARPGALKNTCQQVSAVLSDGPDPGADPVGYAEAQILPLRQIHTTDSRLRAALAELSSAYRRFTETRGDRSAKRAVSVASRSVNAICPGAAA
jgi:hypothetical protein